MSLMLKGERVQEVAALLENYRRDDALLREFKQAGAMDANYVVVMQDTETVVCTITGVEIEAVMKARIVDAARLLGNVGLNVEVPA